MPHLFWYGFLIEQCIFILSFLIGNMRFSSYFVRKFRQKLPEILMLNLKKKQCCQIYNFSITVFFSPVNLVVLVLGIIVHESCCFSTYYPMATVDDLKRYLMRLMVYTRTYTNVSQIMIHDPLLTIFAI